VVRRGAEKAPLFDSPPIHHRYPEHAADLSNGGESPAYRLAVAFRDQQKVFEWL